MNNRTLPSQSVTIMDVARAAGVAKATASYALSGKGQLSSATRETVLKAARELGFEPNLNAQRLSNGRCDDTIGLFSPSLDLGVMAQKVQAIQRLLVAEGFRVPVYTHGYDAAELPDRDGEAAALLADLRRQRPRALICSAVDFGSLATAVVERFLSEGGILVTYDYPLPLACDQVIFDREDNTYQAAYHLLKLGHREIGLYMPGPEPRVSHPRRVGFERALAEFGVTVRPEWFFCGGNYEEGGSNLARQFLTLRRRPTAMCVVNDDAAVAFIAEIGRAGIRVPDDLSVVSHDDLPIARFFPVTLTTVSNPVEAVSKGVHSLLMRRLQSPDATVRSLTVKGELMIRQSAAAPP